MKHEYNTGSEWSKWDLHIHSNASDGKMTPEEIINKSCKEGLTVIALTDHHTAKNIDTIKVLGDQIGVKVIAGIEFRTEYGNKSVHMIGLFPDKYNEQTLNSKSLHDLILAPLGLSETAIIAKGKEGDASILEDKAFKKGMFLLQVDFRKAADIIHSYGGIISVHAGSKANSIDEEMKHKGTSPKNVSELYDSLGTVKEELMKGYIDVCEIRKENDSEEFYYNEFNKPSIIASDSHELEEIGGKFTWLKAEPSFDGLKQIICEPLERVRIQLKHPDDKKSYNVIDKIKFVNKSGENKFSEQKIGFNSGLNAIIGGKSSGKSLLLHMIALEIGNRIDIKDYKDVIGDSTIEVYYKDNPTQKRTTTDSRIIEFLPQLHIERLVRNQEYKNTTTRSFNEFIENLIKQDDHIKDIITTSREKISTASSSIESSIIEWGKVDGQLKIAKEERVKLGDRTAIENEIKNIKIKIETLTENAGWSKEEKELYDKLIKENQDKETRKEALIQTIEDFNRLKICILNQLKNTSDNSIQFTSENEKIIEIVSGLKTLLNASISVIIKSFSSKIDDEISSNAKLIELLKAEIQKNNTDLQPLMNKNAIQFEISKLESSQKEEEVKVKEIDEKDKQIQSIRNQIMDLRFVAYSKDISDSYYELSAALNKSISNKWNVETTKLDIKSKAIFNSSVFVDSISGIVNMKGYLSNQFGEDIFTTNDYSYDKELHLEKLTKLIQHAIKENDRFANFKSGKTTKEFLTSILKDCFVIEYDIIKGSDSLHSMSEGKKGIVILQLYLSLSQSDCPILIDQPEDNLDNRTVYQELNDYIKQSKRRRQIIMVSHNANLVVNTDAENVIVANQSGEDGKENKQFKFEYVNGSLENTFINNAETAILYKQGIREHVCDILEGGVDAFKKREEKYHIKN